MAIIDRTESDLLRLVEKRFWAILSTTVQDVLKGDPEIVAEYRRHLEAAPVHERWLALHDDPADVAATLSGERLSEDQLRQYDRIRASVEAPPSPRSPEAETIITLPQLRKLMKELGYDLVPQSDPGRIVTWTKVDPRLHKEMPVAITMMPPESWPRQSDTPGYQRGYVLDLLVHLFQAADAKGASDGPGLMSQQSLLEALRGEERSPSRDGKE